MSLLSDRAQKTGQVVVMPANFEDRGKSPAGIYRLGLILTCAWIFTFFGGLLVAFFARATTMAFWEPIPLPRVLWLSTGLMGACSVVFEAARRFYRMGEHRTASRMLLLTACLGAAFLASQLTAWHELMQAGYLLAKNPFSSFIYIFTGLHGLHLLGGLVALSIVLLRRSKRRELVDAVCYYWHFMGVLWIILFAALLIA